MQMDVEKDGMVNEKKGKGLPGRMVVAQKEKNKKFEYFTMKNRDIQWKDSPEGR